MFQYLLVISLMYLANAEANDLESLQPCKKTEPGYNECVLKLFTHVRDKVLQIPEPIVFTKTLEFDFGVIQILTTKLEVENFGSGKFDAVEFDFQGMSSVIQYMIPEIKFDIEYLYTKKRDDGKVDKTNGKIGGKLTDFRITLNSKATVYEGEDKLQYYKLEKTTASITIEDGEVKEENIEVVQKIAELFNKNPKHWFRTIQLSIITQLESLLIEYLNLYMERLPASYLHTL